MNWRRIVGLCTTVSLLAVATLGILQLTADLAYAGECDECIETCCENQYGGTCGFCFIYGLCFWECTYGGLECDPPCDP